MLSLTPETKNSPRKHVRRVRGKIKKAVSSKAPLDGGDAESSEGPVTAKGEGPARACDPGEVARPHKCLFSLRTRLLSLRVHPLL